MPCGAKEASGVYRPRRPQESPFYQLVERFFPRFEAVDEARYQERYGFWRPIISTVVRKFLECGDLKHRLARVRCPRCREEFFVAYSCQVRCFCPSCHEKRALDKAGGAEHVCAEVSHRQFVPRSRDPQAAPHLLPIQAPFPGRAVPRGGAYGDRRLSGRQWSLIRSIFWPR